MPQRFRRPKPEWARPASAGGSELALVTAVADDLAPLVQQRRFLRDVAPCVHHVVVVDDLARARASELLASDPDVTLLEVAREDFTIGRARNVGASAAIARGCDGFINLGVVSMPLPGFVEAYREAFMVCDHSRGWLFNGPITYLAAEDDLTTMTQARASALVDPHPRRAFPPPGDVHVNADHRLFLAENFAVRVREWRMLGGFCPDYRDPVIGDLDLALRAEQAGFMMAWVGGAHVLHAPSSSSGSAVDDLAVFTRRWGREPADQEFVTRTSA